MYKLEAVNKAVASLGQARSAATVVVCRLRLLLVVLSAGKNAHTGQALYQRSILAVTDPRPLTYATRYSTARMYRHRCMVLHAVELHRRLSLPLLLVGSCKLSPPQQAAGDETVGQSRPKARRHS